MLRECSRDKNVWMKTELGNPPSSFSAQWKVGTEVMRNPQADTRREDEGGGGWVSQRQAVYWPDSEPKPARVPRSPLPFGERTPPVLSTSDLSISICLKEHLVMKSLSPPSGIFYAFPLLEQTHKAHHFAQMELRLDSSLVSTARMSGPLAVITTGSSVQGKSPAKCFQ